MAKMSEETKAKIRAAHKKRAQDPAVCARLKAIASDPVMCAARAAKMKAKWADPDWRANQLAKKAARTTTPVVDIKAVSTSLITGNEPQLRKKRVVTEEQKAKYAANRKAKREAAKLAGPDGV